MKRLLPLGALALVLVMGCANTPLPQLSVRVDIPALGSGAIVVGHPDMDHDHDEDSDDAKTD